MASAARARGHLFGANKAAIFHQLAAARLLLFYFYLVGSNESCGGGCGGGPYFFLWQGGGARQRGDASLGRRAVSIVLCARVSLQSATCLVRARLHTMLCFLIETNRFADHCRDGDRRIDEWRCAGCSKMNFARHATCRGCNQPKPAGLTGSRTAPMMKYSDLGSGPRKPKSMRNDWIETGGLTPEIKAALPGDWCCMQCGR